uniref:FYVE, RhoGEF and PH domain-containing protein 6-like n=1 Tax=Echeneis naucrates TaxID=173247 RepID=A0A665VRE2_ECHNA
MHKPPLAPKPKLVQPQRPGLSPSTPRRQGLSIPSHGTQKGAKPVLAPKPCLSKLTTVGDSKPAISKSLHQTSATGNPQIVGLLNSQNGIQQENKKPDWDYIIPICLCSQENCQCTKNSPTSSDKAEKDLKTWHKGNTERNRKHLPASQGAVDRRERTDNAQSQVINATCLLNKPASTNTNHNSLHGMLALDKNLNTDISTIPAVKVRPPLPQRTWSDEVNGNVIPQSTPGRGQEEDVLGSEQTYSVSRHRPAPAAPGKPIPVPRKHKTAVLIRQEKVGKEREGIINQERKDMNVNKVRVSLEGKDASSQSVSIRANENKEPIVWSQRKASTPPVPPPKKKPFLSAPEKLPTYAPEISPRDGEKQDRDWDSSVYEMEQSVDKKLVEKTMAGKEDQEPVLNDLPQSSPPCSFLSQQEIGQPPAVVGAPQDGVVKVCPKKPQRHSSLILGKQRQESSEEQGDGKGGDNEKQQVLSRQDNVLRQRVMRELPLPPEEKTNRNATAGIEPSRGSFGKQRHKSFSSADLFCSEGQRRNSFRKLLDLKLSVKMLPKLIVRGSQSADCIADENEQSVDKDQDACQNYPEYLRSERKFSCPVLGVEQSVDGDDVFYGRDEDVHYENMRHYEEIPDYINVELGKEGSSPRATFTQPLVWDSDLYNDEGIYEEQEPFISFEKNTGPQQSTSTDYESSTNEDVAPLGDGPSDDEIAANTSSSDEEDENDSSSISSKGDPEPLEEINFLDFIELSLRSRQVPVFYSVFVRLSDLQDFRAAVSEASRQNGKPVIEERVLNQILYYLPQLYELNQDLLRELKQRLAKWDENAQLSDIFLKKGPYLKMYSTYIREYDKNVALLEEHSKRNPAFGAVVREFEASPRCANLALKHYLLKPVQRIPQYQLLFTDYLKNLSEESDDYKDTQAALALVKEVANHANDIMKQGDNFQKLIQVQCSLTGHHEIVQPGRIFLKEGVLMKLARKVMQPRKFFLFNDILLYTTPVQAGQYKLNKMLCLAGMKVSKPSQEAYQNELNIESVERSFILSASSATERDEWLEAISTAISDYTRRKITFISGKPPEEGELSDAGDGAPLGSKAPIWIPDPRATMCMICTCEFTLTWRRHHCRACGKVVCQSCSSNKYRLEYLKNRLARVCHQCFHVLHEQKNETSSSMSPGNRATFAFSRKQKKIPAALKEVTANTDNSSMSGYLHRSKSAKKQGKKLWFVIKDKVLYTYAASEDVAALESQPLLGFMLKEDLSEKLEFKLYHKNTLYHIFKADDEQTAQRWINSFKEATVL